MSTERRAGRCQWHSSVSTTDFENLTYFSLYIVESEQTFSDSIRLVILLVILQTSIMTCT